MLTIFKVNRNDLPDSRLLGVLKFRTSRRWVYEKLEKHSPSLFWGRLKRLLACHSAARSEMLGLLCRVIVLNAEHHMLPQLSLSRNFREL